jgi:hypothetical protein
MVVAGAGLCYLAVVLAAKRVFEGITSAVFVLALFDITITLVEGPGIATIDIVAVDVVAVPLLFVLLYESLSDQVSFRFDWSAVAVVGFVAFVCWTFAAGVVANGVSAVAPMLFATEQLRYLVLFVVTALIVQRTSAWCAIYPFVIASIGNLLVSLAQIANGGMLGFPFLGEPPDRFLGAFVLGGFEIATGFHAGGFVGHGRELAMVLLMCIPLVLVVSLRHSWMHTFFAALIVVASILSIRVADTDAGWATLILLGAVFGAYVLADLIGTMRARYPRIAAVSVLGCACGMAFVLARGGLAVVRSASGSIPLLRTDTLQSRIRGYVAAVEIALDHPLFGLGGKNFYLVSEQYGLWEDLGIHNTFLSHLAATGFVGLFFYLVSVLAVLFIALRLAHETSGNERLLWVATVCAMVGFHAYSSWMMAYHWTVGNSAFWLLAGTTVGTAIDVGRC